MDKPIGTYLSTKIKKAVKAAGGFMPIAQQIPSPRSKSGHLSPDFIRRLTKNPTEKISDAVRQRIKDALKQPSAGANEEQHVVKRATSSQVTVVIGGHQVEGTPAALAQILKQL